MTLDERASVAAAAVRSAAERVKVPNSSGVVDRVARRHRIVQALAAIVVVGVVGVAALVVLDGTDRDVSVEVTNSGFPAGSATAGAWAVVPKAHAGLGAGASPAVLVSDGDAVLLAGSRPDDGITRAAIWRSTDGARWDEADHPSAEGSITAMAEAGGTAIAIGGAELGDAAGSELFVWRSTDGGRHWTEIARGAMFGLNAPDMGRPFVSDLVAYDGGWVASGGGSNGYGAVWASPDGTEWSQSLDWTESGSVKVITRPGGGLAAFSILTTTREEVGWITDDPTRWGDATPLQLPDGIRLTAVSDRGDMAAGTPAEAEGYTGTSILRSDDGGRTWVVDDAFLGAFPTAGIDRVSRVAGVWAAVGQSRATPDSFEFDHEEAWVSLDGRQWETLPSTIRRVGYPLELLAAVDDRIVMFSTKSQATEYYVVTTADLQPVDPGDQNDQLDAKITVAEGQLNDVPWELEAYNSDQGLCLDLRYLNSAGGGCGHGVPPRALGLNTTSSPSLTATFGPARSDVARVEAVLASGDTTSFTPVGKDGGFGVNFYIFILENGATIDTVIAYDTNGTEIDRMDARP